MTQASLIASKVVGVAPMAVHFDATDTVDSIVTDTFRELQYQFDFGDPNSGNWEHSGKPKNTQNGAPIAAHVYDEPGTYTATVRVGNAVAQVQISVASADTVWADTDTVCLSMNTDFTGSPTGAEQIPNISAWPVFADGKRYMLHEGQDFSALGTIQLGQAHDMRIDSFGSSAKPIVGSVQLQAVTGGYPDTAMSDWMSNVQVIGLSAFSIQHNISGEDILIYQNNIHSGGENTGIFFGNAWHWYKSIDKYPNSLMSIKNFFVIENTSVAGPVGDHNGLGQQVWMGNELTNTKAHNMRLWQSYKTVIAHNLLGGNSDYAGKGNMKIHAEGFATPIMDSVITSAYHPNTQYVVISDNIVNSANSTNMWVTLSIKPQDSAVQEGVQDVIMERNTHINGIGGTQAGAFAGRNITTRNETFAGGVNPPSVGHFEQSLPIEWRGPYFIDVPMPAAPDGTTPPIDPPIEPPIVCDEGYELIDGECVEIPPIDPPTEPCTCVDGAQGVQGIQGIQGIQGLPGADGADAEVDPLMDEALDFYDYVKAYFTQ